MIRWTAAKKAAVVLAMREADDGARLAVMRRHNISDEELAAWQRDYDAHGLAGLQVTKQVHRKDRR